MDSNIRNYRVAIVEDIPMEAELLKTFLGRFESEASVAFQIDLFQDGKRFLHEYLPVFDLVLMDIGLPNLNGMETAMQLRQVDERVTLIFVTNMAQFAVQGYEAGAFDYILKPINYPSFKIKLQRAIKRLQVRQDREIVINQAESYYRCAVSQIRYVEIRNHSIYYHTSSGVIESYGSLKQVEDHLAGCPFVRCNHCYLVNLSYVQIIQMEYVVLTSGERLKVSRMKRKPLIQALNLYLGEG